MTAGSYPRRRELLDGVRKLALLRVDAPRRPEIPSKVLSTGMGERSALIDLHDDVGQVW